MINGSKNIHDQTTPIAFLSFILLKNSSKKTHGLYGFRTYLRSSNQYLYFSQKKSIENIFRKKLPHTYFSS